MKAFLALVKAWLSWAWSWVKWADAKFMAAMKDAHPELNVGVKQADPNETVVLVRFRPSASISLLGSSAGDCADLGSKGG